MNVDIFNLWAMGHGLLVDKIQSSVTDAEGIRQKQQNP